MPGDLSGWDEIRRKVAELGRAHVRAGVVGEVAFRKHADSDITLGDLAIIHELGIGVPQRSFVRSTVDDPETQAGFRALQARVAREVIEGRMSRDVGLAILGRWIARRIHDRVMAGEIKPPNAPATVRAKGSSIPLVDTGELADMIDWEIVK